MSAGWRWRGQVYRAAEWERRFRLVARVTTRAQGDMKDPARWRRALEGAGLDPANWAGGAQVHGRRVRRATRPTAPKEFPGTDGLIAAKPNLALRVFSADCVPIFLFDPKRRVAGLVHAGWRGAANDILGAALARAEAFGCKAGDFWVTLGPHIQDCCYTVGPEVAGKFPRQALSRQKGALRLSLAKALARQARAAGVRRFSSAAACTACDGRFYSYRQEKTEQRQAAMLAARD